MPRAQATLTIALLSTLAALGACSSTAPPAPTPVVVAAPPPPPAPGVLDGPIGQSLDEKDRAAAIAAQHEAVSSGTRKSWRGERGAYGIVTPGAENGVCREYAHRIFVNGRPKEARGQACRDNGEWRVKS
ncbi:MAG: hypothetical protein ACR652_25595 [Methylocystis sp.]|uniref:hypothetical protein n=1 Tax=Methylocystis sp. TaxID=1911079 RepID=UPI003DA3944A